MPFQPGHKINEGRPATGRATRETKRALKNLALSIREGVHPDEIRDWLVKVWRGIDPQTGVPVELKNRAAALQMLLDRGWGQAAQHVIVEGEIRTEMIASEPSKRKQMTLEEINARRAELRAARVQPAIIDAHSTEHKQLPSGDEDDSE